MKWFRLYSEVLNDPKVQQLKPELFKFWINLLCLANAQPDRGTLPSIEEISYALRIRRDHVERYVAFMEGLRLLSRDVSGALKPHNWDARQPACDNIAKRVTKYRERSFGNRGQPDVTLQKCYSNSFVTGPEAESSEKEIQEAAAPAYAREETPPTYPDLEPAIPGNVSPAPGPFDHSAEAAAAFHRELWGAYRNADICRGWWRIQRRHDLRAWRYAIAELASRDTLPSFNSANYLARIAEDWAPGVEAGAERRRSGQHAGRDLPYVESRSSPERLAAMAAQEAQWAAQRQVGSGEPQPGTIGAVLGRSRLRLIANVTGSPQAG